MIRRFTLLMLLLAAPLFSMAEPATPPPPAWLQRIITVFFQNESTNLVMNPTTDRILKLRIKKDFEIFDNKGKLVKKGSSKEIDLSDLPKGSYTIRFDKDYNQIEYFKKV